jgi:hypothetical protein
MALTPLGHLECHLVTPPWMSSLLDLDLSLTLARLSLKGVEGQARFGPKLPFIYGYLGDFCHPSRPSLSEVSLPVRG